MEVATPTATANINAGKVNDIPPPYDPIIQGAPRSWLQGGIQEDGRGSYDLVDPLKPVSGVGGGAPKIEKWSRNGSR